VRYVSSPDGPDADRSYEAGQTEEWTLNSKTRVQHRLQGKAVDRIPNFNIMMTFACHHINQPLSKYYLDHTVLAQANFCVQQDFQLDLLQAISDPYREAHDLGSAIYFPQDGLPVCTAPLIRAPQDILSLKWVCPESGQRMRDRLQAISLFQEKKQEVMSMGWVEGALALTATLLGVSQLLIALCDEPEWLDDLLAFCCEQETSFALAQIQAGADIIGLGDAIASQVSPEFYQRFAWPYEQRIFNAVKQAGALTRLHICGDTHAILPGMAMSGADIIDVDWMVDIKKAAQAFATGAAVCGNQNPVSIMRFGAPQEVEKAVTDCIRHGGPRCFNAAGCEIPDATPPENLFAQNQALIVK
jgi:MtaA/CmuA family methyltransferase